MTRVEPEVAGWKLSPPELMKWKPKGDDGEWVLALPFVPMPEAIIRDEDGQIRGFRIRFIIRGSEDTTVVAPSLLVRVQSPSNVLAAVGGPDLSTDQARVLVKLLTDVIAGKGKNIEEDTVVTRAVWRGDVLYSPGVNPVAEWQPELAAYGVCADIDEEQARENWAEIVELALTEPKAMMVLGMPIGSIYCAPLRADSFAMHLTAESSTGKTESAEIAMSALSSARRPHGALYRTWDASAQAPTNLLKMVGPLPVWFDETAVFAGDDVEFTNLLFRLAQGRGRLIADVEGGLRSGSGERWDACLLSTGEARVSNRSGLTGLRRRVIEIYAPLTHVETHDQMLSLARKSYGWPLRWLVQDPDPQWARDLHMQIFGAMSDEAKSQQVEVAQAANLATCAVGFGTLARLTGASITARQLADAAKSVFRKILAASADEGADIGERALWAVKEAIQRSGNFYAPEDEMFIQRWGVTFDDGYVGIIGAATLAEILLRYAKLTDPVPVLERWADDGILQHDQKKHTGRRSVYVPGSGMRISRLYLVKVAG